MGFWTMAEGEEFLIPFLEIILIYSILMLAPAAIYTITTTRKTSTKDRSGPSSQNI